MYLITKELSAECYKYIIAKYQSLANTSILDMGE